MNTTGYHDTRRRWISGLAACATLGSAIFIGPALFDALFAFDNPSNAQPSADLDTPATPNSTTSDDTRAAPPSPNSTTANTTPDSAPTTTDDEDPTTTEVGTDPTITDVDDPTQGARTMVRPLRTIQLVPPLRDVIVDVDGRGVASDASGVIDLTDTDPDVELEFVGIEAEPALRAVALVVWSDGSVLAERRLSTIDGPNAEIGLVVSHRVTVSSQQTVPEGTQLVFESEAGTVSLTPGRSAWVPATRAVPGSDGGLVEQPLAYTLVGTTLDDASFEIPTQEFTPTPEALWVVSTDGAEPR